MKDLTGVENVDSLPILVPPKRFDQLLAVLKLTNGTKLLICYTITQTIEEYSVLILLL